MNLITLLQLWILVAQLAIALALAGIAVLVFRYRRKWGRWP